jgi:hypothetical protein
VDEAADVPALLGRLEEHVGADDVAVRGLEAAAEGVVDVRLGGEVHDSVDLPWLEHALDEVGSATVALDEPRGGPGGLSQDRGAPSPAA